LPAAKWRGVDDLRDANLHDRRPDLLDDGDNGARVGVERLALTGERLARRALVIP
jgi:hypothetical protein